jgi:C4-dicarboxylate-binding protein DctP
MEMRAIGAIPQVLAFSEVYQALQTGVVDGTENPPSNFYTQKFFEVQKFMTQTQHGYLGYALIVNKPFWDGLPADIRKTLDQAMKESTEFANSVARKDNEDATEAVRKSGKCQVLALTPAERLAWKKAMVPVYAEAQARVPKALMDEVFKATGFDPAKL